MLHTLFESTTMLSTYQTSVHFF